jgi:toxin ParE1/3/4
MNLELSTDQIEFITECTRSGRYRSAEEVIGAALDLLRDEVDEAGSRQAALQQAIIKALEDVKIERLAPLDIEKIIAELRSRPVREDLPKADGRVQGTASAVDDLHRIWKIFGRENPDAADNQVRKLADRCRRVSTMPGMGRPRTDLGERVQSVTAQRFMIYYVMHGLTLIVLRILPAED